MIIPDYISPIVAYRTWKWDADGLKSLNAERWLPGEALEARCRAFPLILALNGPHERCSCGIYAAKDVQHLIETGYMAYGQVHGEVYLWGKIYEHTLGYRAQYAYPKAFVLPYDVVPYSDELECRLQSLITYAVEAIIMVAFMREMRVRPLAVAVPLWTKLFGFNATGFKWLRLWNKLRSTEPSAPQCWTPGFYKI